MADRDGQGVGGIGAADQEATQTEQALPAAFTASVTIEDKGSIAARNEVTVKADFIGMNDDVPLFADLTVYRGIYGVASWRAPVGSAFNVFVAGNGWCRLTVEEINFLPPEVGESDEHAEQDVQPERPAKLNVILSIENVHTFP